MNADTSDALKRCIETYAADAGLASHITAFPRMQSIEEALATNPFLMAPMAGVSDAAYRIMARLGGAALAYTEMVSVAGLHYVSDKTWELAEPHAVEPDIAVQLFGSKPEQFTEAIEKLLERLGEKLVVVDLNMACPVPKVVKKGEGSALMESPQAAAQIVKACVAQLPDTVFLTAKIRRGRYLEKENAPEFARVLEQSGIDAITVHGRYAAQLYRGSSDIDSISRVVQAVSVPVLASGDMTSAQAAAHALETTGAKAVMCARGTYGNPWIFGDAARCGHLSHDICERMAAFRLHVRLMGITGAHLARARSLATWYLKGMPGAARWRERAMTCVDESDFLELAWQVEDELS